MESVNKVLLSESIATSSSAPDDDRINEIHPFVSETDLVKAMIMLGWILDAKFDKKMLNKSNKLEDADAAESIATIKQSENQSKLLRILEADINLIEDYVSCNIFNVIVQIRKFYDGKKVAWACIECNDKFQNLSVCWKCQRCLLWFHTTCKTKYPRQSEASHAYCDICYMV